MKVILVVILSENSKSKLEDRESRREMEKGGVGGGMGWDGMGA